METEKKSQAKIVRTDLPLEGLVELPTVLSVYPVSKSTLYREIRDKRFPAPIKRGRSSYWDAGLVRNCLKEMGATMT